MIAGCPDIQRELKLIAGKMGLNPDSPTVGIDVADAITERNRAFGIKPLKEFGLTFDQVKEAIPQIMADGRLIPNAPVDVTEADVETMLRGMYEY